jgi:hypothetical protein
MNWFKENPVPAAILAFALLGTAATTYLALQASGRNSLAIDEFNNQITTLRRLQAKKPFPNAENQKKVVEAVNAYGTATTEFISGLGALEAPLDTSITPQKFQDDLRNAVDSLRAAASKNGVALPEQFFFGFDDFQTQLPTPQQTPLLYREFTVIQSLVQSLVDLSIDSIDSLVRHPKKEEDPEADPEPSSEVSSTATFDSFSLGITAPQEKFVTAFNKIPRSAAFIVLRSMAIENTNPVPPPRVEPTPAPVAASPFDTAENAADEKLPVVFGRESVKATLLFEIPDFPGESATAAVPEQAPAPAN